MRGVDREGLRDILMTYLAGRLYLRVKRGVHVDPFDGVPKLKKYYDEQDFSSFRLKSDPKAEDNEDELASQMNIFDTEENEDL